MPESGGSLPQKSRTPGAVPLVPSTSPGPALQLGRVMRSRLRLAVRTLLADRRIVDRKDVVRVAALVLTAKAGFGSCRVESTARELGRWVGVSESTIDHEVLGVLRDTDAVAARVLRGGDGLPTGVEYRVEALWEARSDVGAPLALSKVELATLLRFVEALFAPGWGEACETPPGLLAKRRGRGAASDRLALVLLALNARPDGRVPLVGGPLAKSVARFGRAAVTLARMLGCRVQVAAVILGRLVEAGAVTGGSKRLVVPAVAAAHGAAAAAPDVVGLEGSAPVDAVPAGDVVGCTRCSRLDEVGAELVVEGDGWRQLSWDDLEGVEGGSRTAPRDPEDVDGDLFAGQTVFETLEASRVAAGPHTDHAVVADVDSEGAGGVGFSGEAASGSCRLPERAGAGEDSPAPEAAARGAATAVGGGADPLRGENPDLLFVEGEAGSLAAEASLEAWRGVSGGPPPVWAQVPRGLEQVLEPVAMVWGRLDRLATRQLVAKAVRARLGEIAASCGPEVDAGRILRERLHRRVREQGAVQVNDPVGWLIGRALPRRALCPDLRCDDGRRMDTGGDCPACQMLVLDGRALRGRALTKATAVAGGRVDRPVFEAELNACWRVEAATAAVARERAVREQHARELVWAQQQAQYAAQEAARQSLACSVCGELEAAGLCGRCRDERCVEELVAEAVDVAVAAWGMGSEAHRLDVVCRTERDMRGAVDQAVASQRAAGESGFAQSVAVALAARVTAELQLGELRRRAVAHFACQGAAQTEFEKVYATEVQRWHLYDSVEEAREGAEEAAQRARFNTAHTLLKDRVRALRAARAEQGPEAEPGWYSRAADRARALMRLAAPERVVSVPRRPPSPVSPGAGSGAGMGA